MFYLLLLLSEVEAFELLFEFDSFRISDDVIAGNPGRPDLVQDEVACVNVSWRNVAEELDE